MLLKANFSWLDNMMLSLLICYLVGMSSACTNPVLYGLLNPNIQQEYRNILLNIRKILALFKPKPPQAEIAIIELTNLS